MGQLVTDEVTKEVFIGKVEMKKGMIGALEEKVFTRQFLGKLETGVSNSGTDVFELAENIRHVLEINLNSTDLGENFYVDVYKDEVLPYVRAYNLENSVTAEIKILADRNSLKIEAQCNHAKPVNANKMERALNEVIKNGVRLSDGWGE